jgi:hypothetical protein
MSAITTTPAPTIGRKPVVIGVAILGVVTIAVVTIPNIHLSGTTSVPAVVQAQAPDALDRRDAMLAAAAAESSRRTESLLDARARSIGHHTVVGSPAAALPAHLAELGVLATAYGAAATSVGREQVGGYHRTYTWTPAMAALNPLHSIDAQEQVPGLQGHYEYGAPASAAAVSALMASQVGGLHTTYVYNGRGLTYVTLTQAYDGRALHLTWSDPWVPPVDNPDWTPFIRAHYYGGTVPERIVTRGD